MFVRLIKHAVAERSLIYLVVPPKRRRNIFKTRTYRKGGQTNEPFNNSRPHFISW